MGVWCLVRWEMGGLVVQWLKVRGLVDYGTVGLSGQSHLVLTMNWGSNWHPFCSFMDRDGAS
jgi:hypothetical protein